MMQLSLGQVKNMVKQSHNILRQEIQQGFTDLMREIGALRTGRNVLPQSFELGTSPLAQRERVAQNDVAKTARSTGRDSTSDVPRVGSPCGDSLSSGDWVPLTEVRQEEVAAGLDNGMARVLGDFESDRVSGPYPLPTSRVMQPTFIALKPKATADGSHPSQPPPGIGAPLHTRQDGSHEQPSAFATMSNWILSALDRGANTRLDTAPDWTQEQYMPIPEPQAPPTNFPAQQSATRGMGIQNLPAPTFFPAHQSSSIEIENYPAHHLSTRGMEMQNLPAQQSQTIYTERQTSPRQRSPSRSQVISTVPAQKSLSPRTLRFAETPEYWSPPPQAPMNPYRLEGLY